MTNLKDKPRSRTSSLRGKNLIILILAIICIVLAGGLIYSQFGQKIGKDTVNIKEVEDLILTYINESLLQGQLKASLVGEIEEEAGLYKFQIEVADQKILSFLTKDGKIFFPEGFYLDEELTQSEERAEEKNVTLGNFSVSDDEICLENDKPIVYFFGSEGCSYCKWEHPIIEKVAGNFEDFISFHNNMGDSEADREVFEKYSPNGYVPAVVLGCQYYRVGAGTQIGEEAETEALIALICDLTKNQPFDVCEYE